MIISFFDGVENIVGKGEWLSQSEVVLHPNVAKFWRIRQRTFLRMIGECRAWMYAPGYQKFAFTMKFQ